MSIWTQCWFRSCVEFILSTFVGLNLSFQYHGAWLSWLHVLIYILGIIRFLLYKLLTLRSLNIYLIATFFHIYLLLVEQHMCWWVTLIHEFIIDMMRYISTKTLIIFDMLSLRRFLNLLKLIRPVIWLLS
jgi:hypothetical protein